MKKIVQRGLTLLALTTLAMSWGCGGGGSSSPVLYYPYENLYGEVCDTFEPVPGCTFLTSTGERITVTEDPDYDYYGYGSDDMWYVVFNSSGTRAEVYDEAGRFQHYLYTDEFDHHVGGYQIGLGTTGLFWEDVRNGTYWFGRNGVLYSANPYDSNFGQAINSDAADVELDTNMLALTSAANQELVGRAAKRLVEKYEFSQSKATAVASALNKWGLDAVERGYTTTANMDATFSKVFGVGYTDALKAVKDYSKGEREALKPLVKQTAASLGIRPDNAAQFLKDSYRKALSSWGYDVDDVQWNN